MNRISRIAVLTALPTLFASCAQQENVAATKDTASSESNQGNCKPWDKRMMESMQYRYDKWADPDREIDYRNFTKHCSMTVLHKVLRLRQTMILLGTR